MIAVGVAFIMGGLLLATWVAFALVMVSKAHLFILQGRRNGLKQAAEIVRLHAAASLSNAKEGELAVGVVRAQVAHELEVEIRSAVSKVTA